MSEFYNDAHQVNLGLLQGKGHFALSVQEVFFRRDYSVEKINLIGDAPIYKMLIDRSMPELEVFARNLLRWKRGLIRKAYEVEWDQKREALLMSESRWRVVRPGLTPFSEGQILCGLTLVIAQDKYGKSAFDVERAA